MTKNPLESKIETYLKEQVKAVGGLCYKWKSTVNGVPDQVVIFNSRTHFVEVKRPNEEPRANQVYVHQEIERRGVPVYTVDTTEKVDEFLRDILHVEPVRKKPSTDVEATVHDGKNLFKI